MDFLIIVTYTIDQFLKYARVAQLARLNFTIKFRRVNRVDEAKRFASS